MRWRQADQRFKVILRYISNLRPALATQEHLNFKKLIMVSSPSVAPIVISPATLEPVAVIGVLWTSVLEQVWCTLEGGIEKCEEL